MRYLFITTYPPTHCGIASYAYQQVLALREQGHFVDVVSVDGNGNVDFRWDLKGGFRLLKLLRLLPFYDKVVIQYHTTFFYRPEDGADCRRVSLSFLLLFWLGRRKVEVLCHEVPSAGPEKGHFSSFWYRWKWARCPKAIFHTAIESANFLSAFGLSPAGNRIEVRIHHAQFRPFCRLSRPEARLRLGIGQDALVFLSIGFIQPHKGFDRAMHAFLNADIANGHYYVVGSLRLVHKETSDYLDELKTMARRHSNLHVVDQFLTDEEFDMWMLASDWVVLPYREIWSSSVLGRARLLRRPAIVSCVGGLPDQAKDEALFFQNDFELVEIFRKVGECLTHEAHI